MMTSWNDMMRKWEILREQSLKKYPEKQHKWFNSNSAVNTAVYVLSDFEESNDDEDDVEETETWTETFKLMYLVYIFCSWFLKTIHL